jgi:hypothetical protein
LFKKSIAKFSLVLLLGSLIASIGKAHAQSSSPTPQPGVITGTDPEPPGEPDVITGTDPEPPGEPDGFAAFLSILFGLS